LLGKRKTHHASQIIYLGKQKTKDGTNTSSPFALARERESEQRRT